MRPSSSTMPVAHIRHHPLSPVVSGIAEYHRGFSHNLFPRFPVSHCKSVISRFESATTTNKKLCQEIVDFFLHHEHFAMTPLKFSYCQKETYASLMLRDCTATAAELAKSRPDRYYGIMNMYCEAYLSVAVCRWPSPDCLRAWMKRLPKPASQLGINFVRP